MTLRILRAQRRQCTSILRTTTGAIDSLLSSIDLLLPAGYDLLLLFRYVAKLIVGWLI